jgi:hypothetical protein
MRTVAILDTSILLELLQVPGRHSRNLQLDQELRRRRQDLDESLLLPAAAILETGNHIGRLQDGHQRRQFPAKFVQVVEWALAGQAPFSAVGADLAELRRWLPFFVDWVTPRAREFTDLSIERVFEQQCVRHAARRVYVWSLDSDLAGLDRPPRL